MNDVKYSEWLILSIVPVILADFYMRFFMPNTGSKLTLAKRIIFSYKTM